MQQLDITVHENKAGLGTGSVMLHYVPLTVDCIESYYSAALEERMGH